MRNTVTSPLDLALKEQMRSRSLINLSFAVNIIRSISRRDIVL